MERNGFKEKIWSLLKPLDGYCIEILYLVCSMLIIRIVEAIALFSTGYNSELIANNLLGFVTDIAHIGWILAALYLLYYIIGLLSHKAATVTIRTIFAAYLCLSMILTGYFAVTHIPLDSIITAYTPNELYITIKANNPYNIPIIAAIIANAVAFCLIPRKKADIPSWAKIVIMTILICCVFFPGLEKEKFRYDKEYYIVENKIIYLHNSLKSENSIIQFTDSELKQKSEEFATYFPEYEFTDYHYPFMHNEASANILSSFFEKSESKPNIAIIIVEGLCNYISGKNSTIASATPFLDSLSEHALVWENCLSTSERTFGVLPSVLGALPFGEKGFMSYRRDVPEFNTLATILHDNGYTNTFFYGGWYGFDGMDIFAENNYMVMYYDKPEFESADQRNEWGLLDDYMLEHSLDDINKSEATPRLDIYLTLTTHDPFSYPNTDKYIQKYNALPQKGKSISKPNENASFMYADDCQYKKCKTFGKTIFIITGDHKFNVTDKKNIIDNYHVPLIIWSPMLRESRRFPAIVTHRSITPSILSFLKNEYGIKSPTNVAWLNSGLDTCKNFRAETFAPHYGENRKAKGITFGNHFITSNGTYDFVFSENGLSLKKTDADSINKFIKLYNDLENYIMNNNALIKK